MSPRSAAAAGRPSTAPINVLTFSTLYPNRCMPCHGVFVENRLRHLLASGGVAAVAVAPVPWFPWGHRLFGRYATFARVPREEERHAVPVLHPRYVLIPKLGMSLSPFLMFLSLRKCLSHVLRNRFRFDIIDAHYLYPDGVAAVLLGKFLRKPVVVTARGSDVNLIARYRLPGRLIRWAAANAAGVVAVSEALRRGLVDLGVDGGRVHVLRNGVDLHLFAPRDKAAARRELGLGGTAVVASVGALIPRKGHDLVVRAVAALPGATLVVVGEGPQRAALRRLVRKLGLGDRVRFLGRVPHGRLATVYNAADVVALASSREGLPNVLLEALACGTPVVATAVWGTPEIVRSRVAGLLVEERTPAAIAAALRDLLADPPAPDAVRAYAAERFGWAETTAGQVRLFRSIVEGVADAAAARPDIGWSGQSRGPAHEPKQSRVR